MSLQSTAMKAAALYALKRASENITEDDMKRWARQAMDRTPGEWRTNAIDAFDSGLARAGLMRLSAVPSPTGLIVAGVLAGAVVGAGAALFFSPATGPELRQKLASFLGIESSQESPTASAEAMPKGQTTTPIGGTRVRHN